jgi:hypothetical protein
VDRPDEYGVVFSPQLELSLSPLPDEAIEALDERLQHLKIDPWNSTRYSERLPAEMRTAVFGSGAGIVSFVIITKRDVLYVTSINWVGSL